MGASFPEVTQRSQFDGNCHNETSREVTDSKRLSERGWGQWLAKAAAGRATQLCSHQECFGEPSLTHRTSVLSDALCKALCGREAPTI